MAFADAQDNGIVVFGTEPVTIKVAEAVVKGDCIGYSGGWYRALATTGGVIQMRYVAAQDGVAGQEIRAYGGVVYVAGTRFSGGTAGGALYVAESTTDGQYTQTAPTTTGDADKIVGYMLSATEAILIPNHNDDSVA